MTDTTAIESPSKPTVVLNTAHAREMLRQRFGGGEWALVEEVAPSTGGGTRYADAVAVNLWRSRGHAIHGIEIKVSRSDWLRELKQPAKAESVYAFCNHWWIVAPAGVVKDGELPSTWGLLVLSESRLTQTVAAPRLEPKPIDIAFFASLMRRGMESLNQVAAEKMEAAIRNAYAEIQQQVVEGVAQRSRESQRIQKRLQDLKEAAGIDFMDRYEGPSVRALKLAQRLDSMRGFGDDQVFGQLARLAKSLEESAASLRDALAEQSIAHSADS